MVLLIILTIHILSCLGACGYLYYGDRGKWDINITPSLVDSVVIAFPFLNTTATILFLLKLLLKKMEQYNF